MAKIWAKENQYDEALILNQNNHIIETASANIFWIKNNITYTVPLSEGCIAGVSRQVYINKLILENNPAVEEICTLQKLQNADKIFMTNAASGISELKL
jgi:branched-chain amino acid aminotransferase